MNIKNFKKMGPQGIRKWAPISLQVSIVGLIDFIAILLTPGIFLIQIIQICI